MPDQRGGTETSFLRSRAGIALVVFLGVATFLLILEHRAHIPGDYLVLGGLLLACLGTHFFMHRGRDGDHDDHSSTNDR